MTGFPSAMQDTPIRKLGKTSSQNFLNAATPAAGAAAPAGPNQWFAPAPQVCASPQIASPPCE